MVQDAYPLVVVVDLRSIARVT